MQKLLICLIALMFAANLLAASRPPTIPTPDQIGDVGQDITAYYAGLASQWRQYIDTDGETSVALVNLARAYWHSRENKAACMAAERAHKLEPHSTTAIHILALTLTANVNKDLKRAITLLESGLELEPDNVDCLLLLTGLYMDKGQLDKADTLMAKAFRFNVYPRPLQDFGYNLLVGLPERAILITYGDKDTYSTLMMQQGMGIRTDVIIVCYGLLDGIEYVEALLDRYPSLRVNYSSEVAVNTINQAGLITRIVEKVDVPVYKCFMVDDRQVKQKPIAEGLNGRLTRGGMTLEESLKLFLDVYRMESLTDWSITWDNPGYLHRLAQSYTTQIINGVAKDEFKQIDPYIRCRILSLIRNVFEFHHQEKSLEQLDRFEQMLNEN